MQKPSQKQSVDLQAPPGCWSAAEAALYQVDLCMSLFDWAPRPATKAAIKLHDENVLDKLAFEAAAFYVMNVGRF